MRAATVAAEPVEPEIRHDRLAVVAIDAEPGREVGVLAHRRAAARAGIAVRRAELPDRPAEMQRPGVAERRVRVGVERPLLRQPRRSPVLPPVEVPLKALVELARVPVEVARPGAPRNLIGALAVPEVVRLKAGRAL